MSNIGTCPSSCVTGVHRTPGWLATDGLDGECGTLNNYFLIRQQNNSDLFFVANNEQYMIFG